MKSLFLRYGLLAFLMTKVLSVSQAQSVAPPIMGWSSWNTYHVNISDSLIMQQADAMVNTGLKVYGYRYVNIDRKSVV